MEELESRPSVLDEDDNWMPIPDGILNAGRCLLTCWLLDRPHSIPFDGSRLEELSTQFPEDAKIQRYVPLLEIFKNVHSDSFWQEVEHFYDKERPRQHDEMLLTLHRALEMVKSAI